MAGSDHRRSRLMSGPVIILVHPQLGDNIGSCARAMANFGLGELRLVNPRDGWPSESARSFAAGADYILDSALVYDDLRSSLSDLQFVYATTARQREMLKPVRSPWDASIELHTRHSRGERVGIMFGRERSGLESTEVALADEIITFPVNPSFGSLNLSQAVLLMCYEWLKARGGIDGDIESLPISIPDTDPATKDELFGLFEHLEGALERKNYFRPSHKRNRLVENLRTILQKAGLSRQEIHALRGVISSLDGRVPRRPSPPKEEKK